MGDILENTFRYNSGKLYADVSAEMLPKAVSLIKEYLASRLYSDAERQENSLDFMDRTLKSMPDRIADTVQVHNLFTLSF